PIEAGLLHTGGNEVSLTSLDGSWLVFDQVRLEGPDEAVLKTPESVFIREVRTAEYEIRENGKQFQPLLVDVEHLVGKLRFSVRLDNKEIFTETLETGRYQFEAPMPAVSKPRQSKYAIFADGKLIGSGTVKRTPNKTATYADYVDTRIGTAHSRWMIAPGPWMPFSMVKISPDNQNAGRMAGYEPFYESIGTFSHIHEWTLGGLGIFATNGPLKTRFGDEQDTELGINNGYRSRIDKSTEEAPIGYYKADLLDYGIKAELTATTRCSFERFTFPKDRQGARILLDFKVPAETRYEIRRIQWRK